MCRVPKWFLKSKSAFKISPPKTETEINLPTFQIEFRKNFCWNSNFSKNCCVFFSGKIFLGNFFLKYLNKIKKFKPKRKNFRNFYSQNQKKLKLKISNCILFNSFFGDKKELYSIAKGASAGFYFSGFNGPWPLTLFRPSPTHPADVPET